MPQSTITFTLEVEPDIAVVDVVVDVTESDIRVGVSDAPLRISVPFIFGSDNAT